MTPRQFFPRVLRAMDPYARNDEGITAIEVCNVGLLPHLIHSYGMSPDHVCYDGTTPVGHAIDIGDVKRLRLLIGEGADVSEGNRRRASFLNMAIHSSRDEISRILLGQGAVNRDLCGRVRAVEPWMIGNKVPTFR